MTIEKIYDRIADNYGNNHNYDVLGSARSFAMKQIQSSDLVNRANLEIIDMGVGDGKFVQQLHSIFPNAKFTGVDISKNMLKKAKESFDINIVHSCISDIHKNIGNKRFDLVIAHNVLSYVEFDIVLEQCNLLIKPSGYLSLITSNFNTFSSSQKVMTKLSREKSFLASYFAKQYVARTNALKMPKNIDEIKSYLLKAKFEILQYYCDASVIEFKNCDEMRNYYVYSGWITGGMKIRFLPISMILYFASWMLNIMAKKAIKSGYLSFPMEEFHEMEILLIQKSNPVTTGIA